MAKKKKKVDEQLMLDGVIPPGPSFEAKKTKEEIIEADPNQITFDEFIEDSILEKETVNTNENIVLNHYNFFPPWNSNKSNIHNL